MKRLMTLVVVVMVMTAAYAQKRTNYKFKFEYAVEIESETKADCDIVFDIIDRPGESPMIKMVNNSNGEVNNEEMKPMVVYSSDKEIIYFSNADGDVDDHRRWHTMDLGNGCPRIPSTPHRHLYLLLSGGRF